MAKKKEVRLNKIPLGIFLDALLELYNEGLDYVDIVGTPDENQDTVGIVFSKEYMSNAMRDKYDDFEKRAIDDMERDDKIERTQRKIDLSKDDDLNQII
jgi:hypothetical protein